MKKSIQARRIEDRVNDGLISMERRIQAKVRNLCDRKLQVSIQLLGSGQGTRRSDPCNTSRCGFAHQDPSLRDKCENSDKAMKRELARQIHGRQDAKTTIGYRCHQGLSNIVTPYWDNLVANDFWYIFLGQFFLEPCLKGQDKMKVLKTVDMVCPDAFKSEDISIKDPKDIDRINNEYDNCLLPGFFYEANENQDNLDVDSLTIPQLLICKVIATDMFADYLQTVHGNQLSCRMFQRWVKMHYEEGRSEERDTSAVRRTGGYNRMKGNKNGS